MTEILAWTCQAKNKLGYDVLTKHATTSIRLIMNTYVESVWCASGVHRNIYHLRHIRCALLHLAPTLDTTECAEPLHTPAVTTGYRQNT